MLKAAKHPEYYTELTLVITVSEAARLANVHVMTIRYHIDRGNLAAVKMGDIWLISKRSLTALYPEL